MLCVFGLVVFSQCKSSNAYDLEGFSDLLFPGRRLARTDDLNDTFFASLENYQVNAKPASESQYPWVAKVVHSRSQDYPYVCTGSCVSERIFVTAARCIYSLKVAYTSVIYQATRLPAVAFVVPLNGTKQAFDDIGFVVVDRGHHGGTWYTIELVNRNRTGPGFQWFEDWSLSFGSSAFKVIGYATEKGLHRFRAADRKYELSELDVEINMKMCTTILTFNYVMQGFHVPCYHSCTLQQFKLKDERCTNYHGVEGSAVVEATSGKLFGVATWGPYFPKYELPVGFSVPNSVAFYEDYECAKRIRDDAGTLISAGYYQSLCLDN